MTGGSRRPAAKPIGLRAAGVLMCACHAMAERFHRGGKLLVPGPASGPDPGAAGAAPDCRDEVCVTCSDQAVPVRITTLLPGGFALADTGAGPETVSVALVDAVPGDVVLVHAKEAIARLGRQG